MSGMGEVASPESTPPDSGENRAGRNAGRSHAEAVRSRPRTMRCDGLQPARWCGFLLERATRDARSVHIVGSWRRLRQRPSHTAPPGGTGFHRETSSTCFGGRRAQGTNLHSVAPLRLEPSGPVLNVILDRPERRNAFDEELIAELTRVFGGEVEDHRVVVVRGEGKSFSAGADIDWMRRSVDLSPEENAADALEFGRMLELVDRCPAPVIARVQGHSIGWRLGSHCSMRRGRCFRGCRLRLR